MRNQLLQSTPCPKKHGNRAHICHSDVTTKFGGFISKICMRQYIISLKLVKGVSKRPNNPGNRFLMPKNHIINTLHDILVQNLKNNNFLIRAQRCAALRSCCAPYGGRIFCHSIPDVLDTYTNLFHQKEILLKFCHFLDPYAIDLF